MVSVPRLVAQRGTVGVVLWVARGRPNCACASVATKPALTTTAIANPLKIRRIITLHPSQTLESAPAHLSLATRFITPLQGGHGRSNLGEVVSGAFRRAERASDRGGASLCLAAPRGALAEGVRTAPAPRARCGARRRTTNCRR